MKTEGYLVYWNPVQKFGVIECSEPWNGGFKLTKFFLHRSKIVFIVGEPRLDCFVRFRIDNRPMHALASGRPPLPEAFDAEVYPDQQQAEKGSVAVQS
jgi:hypothetical protein